MADSDQTPETTRPPTIRVFGREDTEERAERSLFRRSGDFRYGSSDIPVDEFRRRVSVFLDSIQDVIAEVTPPSGSYELDQIQVNVEISAKGQLSLLGTGGELAGKGGLTFTFTKK
ncbi:Pepco domain-containing protein [Nocardia sp. NPDC003345]